MSADDQEQRLLYANVLEYEQDHVSDLGPTLEHAVIVSDDRYSVVQLICCFVGGCVEG